MRDSRLTLFAVLIVAALFASDRPAFAQTTGDIRGTVSDATGAPLPGAALEVRSAALQGVRTTTADVSGEFRFPHLPPGSYDLGAALEGFTREERTGANSSARCSG